MKRFFLFFNFAYIAISIFAADIEVPDLESRLQNSGNSVPSTAIPVIPSPPLIELPVQSPVEAIAITTVAIPETTQDPSPVADGSVNESQGSRISGFVTLGVGTPGTLVGEVGLQKSYSEQSKVFVSFFHESVESFSRKTRLETTIASSENMQQNWHLGAILEEGSDTNQNKNTYFSSLVRRSIEFAGGYSGFSLDGFVFSSFADKPFYENIPVTSGYQLEPALSYSYETRFATIIPSVSYRYDTVLEEGETHTGKASIQFLRSFSHVEIGLTTGVFFGNDFLSREKKSLSPIALFPFAIDFQARSDKKIAQHFKLTGGLDVYRSSPWAIGTFDPFVNPQGLAVIASDWNVFTSYSAQLLTDLLFEFQSDYKKTAFRRSIVIATDSFESGRFQTARLDRDSLETTIRTVWTSKMLSVNASWRTQWMDVLWQEKQHVLATGFTIFDPSTFSVWESSFSAELYPLKPELPVLSMSATVRPVRDVAVSLSYSDALPRIFGKVRMRNPVYEQQSGVIMLRGTISL